MGFTWQQRCRRRHRGPHRWLKNCKQIVVCFARTAHDTQKSNKIFVVVDCRARMRFVICCLHNAIARTLRDTHTFLSSFSFMFRVQKQSEESFQRRMPPPSPVRMERNGRNEQTHTHSRRIDWIRITLNRCLAGGSGNGTHSNRVFNIISPSLDDPNHR